ncbi:hypothetical protein AAFF_G00411980 [Aldrovandia affinis]|uniref:Uncharacterized protein n=1 Tax=Aldrovandia affinis TaxID=143900 RepID=A0AAD7SDP2_9TELE|nr:hypothetical protein AAFF_G00411980 [Aldrovandia affinis]
MILKSMAQSDDDSPAVTDVNTAIRNERYVDPGLQDYLHKSTALDTQSKSLLHLDAASRLTVYDALTTEIVSIGQQTAMAELFGELFMTQEPGSKSVAKIAEEEVILFKAVDSIPLDADPLE